MDDRDILHHLLATEAEAASLVKDAQSEADRRTAEGESAGRAGYEERFSGKSTELEEDFARKKGQIQREYESALAAYRSNLEKILPSRVPFMRAAEAAFSELVAAAKES